MEINNQNIISFITAKWQGRPCPMCGSKNFTLQNRVFQLMEFHEGAGLSVGGPVIPVVPVICKNCGNTILINAILSGAIKVEEPKTGENS